MICQLCGMSKADRQFPRGQSICRKCIHTMEDGFDVDFAPPERVTMLEGFIRLLGASRRQAVEEDELEVWEEVFLETPEWKRIWILLREKDFFQ